MCCLAIIIEMEETDPHSLRLLADCDRGLPPRGSQPLPEEDVLGFPEEDDHDTHMCLASSSPESVSTPGLDWESASEAEHSSHSGLEFEKATSGDDAVSSVQPYSGVDMQHLFNKDFFFI